MHHEALDYLARGSHEPSPSNCKTLSIVAQFDDSNSSLQAQDYIRVTPALTDYGIDEMQWILKPAFGEPVLINGTLQEIEGHLEGSGILQLPPRPRAERSAAHDQRHNIGRDVNTVKFCGVFPMADAHHIAALVPAIGVISGPAVIGPGPGNCAQVSCAQNSAIWWCNDVSPVVSLISCK